MSNRFLNLVVSCILLLVSTVSALGQTILVEKQDGTKYDELIADVPKSALSIGRSDLVAKRWNYECHCIGRDKKDLF